MKIEGFPSSIEMEKAIIEALQYLGGTADVRSINKKVIELLNLSEEVVQLEDENGVGTLLDYRLRWSRTKLKNMGEIVNVKKGVWSIASL